MLIVDTPNTLTLTRLTPPQVKAVVTALPALVAAGVVTSKLSQVTFRQADKAWGKCEPLAEPWHPDRVLNLLSFYADKTGDKTLRKVVDKMVDRRELMRFELVTR